jgi:hypothetical protein
MLIFSLPPQLSFYKTLLVAILQLTMAFVKILPVFDKNLTQKPGFFPHPETRFFQKTGFLKRGISLFFKPPKLTTS